MHFAHICEMYMQLMHTHKYKWYACLYYINSSVLQIRHRYFTVNTLRSHKSFPNFFSSLLLCLQQITEQKQRIICSTMKPIFFTNKKIKEKNHRKRNTRGIYCLDTIKFFFIMHIIGHIVFKCLLCFQTLFYSILVPLFFSLSLSLSLPIV